MFSTTYLPLYFTLFHCFLHRWVNFGSSQIHRCKARESAEFFSLGLAPNLHFYGLSRFRLWISLKDATEITAPEAILLNPQRLAKHCLAVSRHVHHRNWDSEPS